jgi:hypothetical protein
MQNLDQTNVTNAYVSGMKEQLKMTGNEYNTAISVWTVGYVIGTDMYCETLPPIITICICMWRRPGALQPPSHSYISPPLDTIH